MPVDEPNERGVIAEARDRCRRLLDDLRDEAADLQRPSAVIGAEVLAEGRAAYDQAAAAVEALLRRLDRPAGDPPTGQLETTDE